MKILIFIVFILVTQLYSCNRAPKDNPLQYNDGEIFISSKSRRFYLKDNVRVNHFNPTKHFGWVDLSIAYGAFVKSYDIYEVFVNLSLKDKDDRLVYKDQEYIYHFFGGEHVASYNKKDSEGMFASEYKLYYSDYLTFKEIDFSYFINNPILMVSFDFYLDNNIQYSIYGEFSPIYDGYDFVTNIQLTKLFEKVIY